LEANLFYNPPEKMWGGLQLQRGEEEKRHREKPLREVRKNKISKERAGVKVSLVSRRAVFPRIRGRAYLKQRARGWKGARNGLSRSG